MRELRLLERISRWEGGSERTHQTQTDILVQSLTGHLRRLLNTHRGSVQIDDMYGVPDFSNLAASLSAGSTRDIEEEIRRMVLKYEPRLKAPKVALRQGGDDVLSLRFSLSGFVQVDQREIPLQLTTTVEANGKVHIA